MWYRKISFFCLVHSLLVLLLLLVNTTKAYVYFSLIHFIVEIFRILIQRYGFYKLLFFTFLNLFSAIFSLLSDTPSISIDNDVCINFKEDKRDLLFSLHIFYFQAIIFVQLFFDLKNHVFVNRIDKTPFIQIILMLSLSLNFFCFPVMSLIDCESTRYVSIGVFSFNILVSFLGLFYENEFRLNELYDVQDIFSKDCTETVIYKDSDSLLNNYKVLNIFKRDLNVLDILKHDSLIIKEYKKVGDEIYYKFVFNILLILIIFTLSFMDFLWIDQHTVKNIVKMSIIFVLVLVKKIKYFKSFYSSWKMFFEIYSICVTLIMISTLLIPQISYETIKSQPDHLFINDTNIVFFDSVNEVSMYSHSLKTLFVMIYTVLLFPIYYYVFVNMLEFGIVSSVLTISLLNINMQSISAFIINICLSTITFAFAYIFKNFDVDIWIRLTEAKEREIRFSVIKNRDYVYLNTKTNIYIVSNIPINFPHVVYVETPTEPVCWVESYNHSKYKKTNFLK